MRKHFFFFAFCALFLCTSCKCTDHTFSDWSITISATCDAPGEEVRNCTDCGYTESQPTPALGHTMTEWITTVSATCTENGQQTRNCSACSFSESEPLLAHGHSLSSWKIISHPTCSTPGVQRQTCEHCAYYSEESITMADHTWLSATCTAARTCAVCGAVEGSALGHQYGAWTPSRTADCTNDGTQIRACSVCAFSESNSIPALGHQWKAATCSAPKTCSVCHETSGKKLEHVNNGKNVCALCGTTLTRPLPSASEVYASCSSAVFYIETFDCDGNKLGSGSGFFIDSQGTAVTNYHVIEGAYSAKVTTTHQTTHSVSGIYEVSLAEDWAVLRVDGSNFAFLKMGDSDTIAGGDSVYAIGSPLGLQNTISSGLISNPSRIANDRTYIQTSVPISSGSSGGALLNAYGEVVGITAASYVDGQNLNLAVPINLIKNYCTISVAFEYYDYTNSQIALCRAAGLEVSPCLKFQAWIQQNANARFNYHPAFSFKMAEKNYTNYFSIIVEDGALIFLMRQKTATATFYLHLVVSENYSVELDSVLYSYADTPRFDNYNYSGYSKVMPSAMAPNMKLDFYKYTGPTELQTSVEYTAATMLSDMLTMMDRVFQNYFPNTYRNFPNIRISDFGYINY